MPPKTPDLADEAERRGHRAESPTAIAFFLPQYHPVPENDAWWGPGFTEWRNVTQARPLFRGHEQPHLPADLGFYDLRVPELRAAQAALARRYGIGAFCYYHYWFHGRRILERPVNEILASGQPDFPFCLCWANENWTRAWDGGEREILLKQDYSVEDDERHFRTLLPAWQDPRHLRREGRPVFLIYRATHLPEVRRTLARWRELAVAHGLPGLYLIRVESHAEGDGDPREMGFDAALDFQPRAGARARRVTRLDLWRWRIGAWLGWPVRWRHTLADYEEVAERMLATPAPGYVRHPCVVPGWDNTARRARGGLILRGSTPARYESWLRRTVAADRTGYVFINAWNEWAEGCHLEPCLRHGHAYLEATRRALAGAGGAAAE